MVLTMSLLLANRAFNSHIHMLADGSVVSHAHPFSKSADDSRGMDHQHSGLEFLLLDQLDVLISCAIALFILKAFSRAISLRNPDSGRFLPPVVPISPGRAPPAFM